MAEPILELIALELESRLRGLTTDAGYNSTVSEVVRPGRRGYSPKHMMIVQVQDDPAVDDDNSVDGGSTFRPAWLQPFLIGLFIKPSDEDPGSTDADLNRFSADVVKVVTAPTNWHTLGGYALFARWGNPVRFTDEGFEGQLLQLNVTYRTLENDPYTLG